MISLTLHDLSPRDAHVLATLHADVLNTTSGAEADPDALSFILSFIADHIEENADYFCDCTEEVSHILKACERIITALNGGNG